MPGQMTAWSLPGPLKQAGSSGASNNNSIVEAMRKQQRRGKLLDWFGAMKTKARVRRVPVVVVLLLFNFGIIYMYFTHTPHPHLAVSHTHTEERASIIVGEGEGGEVGKAWPDLPSFTPWLPPPNPSPHTCEAYFGNGFTVPLHIVSPSASNLGRGKTFGADAKGGGALWCHLGETLGTSICEAQSLVMHPSLINMSRGGEPVTQVLGRSEDEEMPLFSPASFTLPHPSRGGSSSSSDPVVSSELIEQLFPQSSLDQHPIKSLLASLRFSASPCTQWIEEPTLLITRFEYANLFHTYTDWYSAYATSRVTGVPRRPHVVFLDGHCQSPMEETWKALFTSFRFAKHFSGPVCFRHAILTPIGYETVLFKGLTETISCNGCPVSDLKKSSEGNTTRLVEFGEMMRAAFGLLEFDSKVSSKPSHHNVLFVRRENYLAHPRHAGKVESRLSNEVEVFKALQNWSSNYKNCNVTLVNGLFAHMSMMEQVQAVQAASVIVGAHGAGLTHIIAARPGTVVLEIISSYYRRPHFNLISKWMGLKYHAINLEGSVADCSQVVAALHDILKGFGC